MRSIVARHRHAARIYTSILLTSASIIVAVAGWSPNWGVSLASLSIGVIGMVFTVREFARSRRRIEEPASPTLLPRLPQPLVDSGYRVIRSKVSTEDFLISSRSVDKLLFEGTDVDVEVVNEPFEPPLAQEVQRHLISFARTVFDDRKIRLKTDLLQVAGTHQLYSPVLVQPTRYFHGMVTNDAAFKRLTRPHFDGMSFCYPNGMAPELNGSSASNHLGASSLAVTSDSRIVLTRQSRWSNISPNLLCPSGSGSADWNDLRPGTSLQSLVRGMVERELCEECGLAPDTILTTRIVGFGRIGWRGGKPEFLCLSVLKVPLSAIRVPRRERRFETAHESEHIVCIPGKGCGVALLDACARLLTHRRTELSYSLEWTLRAIMAIPAVDLDAVLSG